MTELEGVKLVAPYKPDHPVLRPLAPGVVLRILKEKGAQEGAALVNAAMRQRNEAIRKEEEDPYRYGYEPPTWKLADLALGFITLEEFLDDPAVPERWKQNERLREWATREALQELLLQGGNRSSKTEYMCKRTVQCAMRFPKAIIWMFHESENMSVRFHQPVIWKYLPAELKVKRKGKGSDPTYISYSPMTGFSSAGGQHALMLPNGSLVEFRNYQQDPTTIEGGNLGSPEGKNCLGMVGDELMPLDIYETLQYRTATHKALSLLGFTPIQGFTEMVGAFRAGAEVIYSERTDLVEDPKKRDVPLVEQSASERRGIILFHSQYNPYSDWREVYERAKRGGDDVILERVFGVATRRVARRFARFNRTVHVVADELVPEEGTCYQIIDPAGARARNWSVIWVKLDAFGRMWVYREFPSQVEPVPGIGILGEWALPGGEKPGLFDGRRGPAQTPVGLTLEDYKEIFATAEKWEDRKTDKPPREWRETNGTEERVYCRFMDSRFANTANFTGGGNTTLLEECATIHLYCELTSTEGTPQVHEGEELIVDALGYTPNWKSPDDGPQLFIAESCKNTIFCLENYTGKDGQKGATKDFIDLLRYALLLKLSYTPVSERGARARAYGDTAAAARARSGIVDGKVNKRAFWKGVQSGR